MDAVAQLAELLRPTWDWLSIDQAPRPADAIFLLCGNGDGRADQAAALWHAGWAPLILVTGSLGPESQDRSINEAEYFATKLIQLGVDQSQLVLEPRATNTGENIAFGMDRLAELGYLSQRVLLVNRPCFMRRAVATFAQQFPAVEVTACPFPEQLPDYLTDTRRSPGQRADRLCAEVDRIADYPSQGFMTAVEIPSEVRRSVTDTRSFLRHG